MAPQRKARVVRSGPSLFVDVDGPVVLVGCHSVGCKMKIDVGQGHLVADYAIIGATSLDYERIHGWRTSISARTKPGVVGDWRRAVTYHVAAHGGLPRDLSFLYPYAELGPAGVERWIELYADYAGAIDSVLNIL